MIGCRLEIDKASRVVVNSIDDSRNCAGDLAVCIFYGSLDCPVRRVRVPAWIVVIAKRIDIDNAFWLERVWDYLP